MNVFISYGRESQAAMRWLMAAPEYRSGRAESALQDGGVSDLYVQSHPPRLPIFAANTFWDSGQPDALAEMKYSCVSDQDYHSVLRQALKQVDLFVVFWLFIKPSSSLYCVDCRLLDSPVLHPVDLRGPGVSNHAGLTTWKIGPDRFRKLEMGGLITPHCNISAQQLSCGVPENYSCFNSVLNCLSSYEFQGASQIFPNFIDSDFREPGQRDASAAACASDSKKQGPSYLSNCRRLLRSYCEFSAMRRIFPARFMSLNSKTKMTANLSNTPRRIQSDIAPAIDTARLSMTDANLSLPRTKAIVPLFSSGGFPFKKRRAGSRSPKPGADPSHENNVYAIADFFGLRRRRYFMERTKMDVPMNGSIPPLQPTTGSGDVDPSPVNSGLSDPEWSGNVSVRNFGRNVERMLRDISELAKEEAYVNGHRPKSR